MQKSWNDAMASKLLLLLLALIASCVHAQTEPCDDGTTVGYTTLETLVNDELTNPTNAPESTPRGFVLCPGTTLSGKWTPTSSGSIVLLCGADGNPENNCTVPGVSVPPHVSHLSVVGVTFTGFSDAAIQGTASSNTTVEVRGARFQNFNSTIVVNQRQEDGSMPFKVEVKDSVISNGVGGVAFSNGGGELYIEGLDVDDSMFMSLVATGSAGPFEGSTFLRRVQVTESDIEDVFVVIEAADLDAIGVSVMNMKSMERVFRVNGRGSFAAIDNFLIADNDFSNSANDVRWIGVDVSTGAKATLSNVMATNSSHVRHVFSSSSGSILQIRNSKVADLMGGRAQSAQDVSAIAFANTRSEIETTRVEVDNIDMFTAVLFGNSASNLVVSKWCIGTGSAQAAVYASEESTVLSTDNFVDTSYRSIVCNDPGTQLVQEKPGSGCFQTNRTDCQFDCKSFFNATECMVDATESPSAIPSIAPTTSFVPTSMSASPTSDLAETPTVIPTLRLELASIPPSLTTQSTPNSTQSPAPSRIFDITFTPQMSGTQAPIPSRMTEITTTPTLTPQITKATQAPTPSRVSEITSMPQTLGPQITKVTQAPTLRVAEITDSAATVKATQAPTPSRMYEITTVQQTLMPQVTKTTQAPTSSRVFDMTAGPAPAVPAIILLTQAPTASSTHAMPATPVMSPSGATLLIPIAAPARTPITIPMPVDVSVPNPQSPSASGGASVVPTKSQTSQPVHGGSASSTAKPFAQPITIGANPSLAPSKSKSTAAPAVSSVEAPTSSATLFPSARIVASRSLAPDVSKPSTGTHPTMPISAHPAVSPFTFPSVANQPTSLVVPISMQPAASSPEALPAHDPLPTRHKPISYGTASPSATQPPTQQQTQDSCTCEEKSKKKKKESSGSGKGMRKKKGEGKGKGCDCRKKKSGKGRKGKGEKGYIRQNHQANHVLHDLNDH